MFQTKASILVNAASKESRKAASDELNSDIERRLRDILAMQEALALLGEGLWDNNRVLIRKVVG
jgi:hypothetical protein